MNKTVLILLLALSSTSAFTQWGGSGGFGNYGGYGGYSQGRWSGGYTGGWGNSADLTGGFDSTGTTASVANGGAYSCPYAIDNANRAFDQLVEDVRGQVNEWIVYSDLDAVDEVSYYLAKSCDVKKLDVVSEGSQACKGLGGLLKAIVQQAETSAFRGGYQEGAKLSEQALGLGKGVEKGCKVRVVKKQQVQQQKQQNQQGNQQQQKEQIKQQGQEEKTRQSQQKHQVGQKQGSLAKSLDKKFAKISPHNSNKYGQYGNEVGSQLTNKYAGKYTGQYGNNYGKDYIDQGKSMTRLAGNGQGKKYGEDQADLAHKLNKEYTAKYAKGKDNKNEQWKKYQEKYQHNDEEENNFENEEESSFNLDALLMDLTWM